MLMVDNETGTKAMVDAIEREPGRAAVPCVAVGAAGAAAAGAAAARLRQDRSLSVSSSSRFRHAAIVVAELT